MFDKNIVSTSLTSEIADRLFPNITAAAAIDRSFVATLRALLYKRLAKDKSVKVVCKRLFHPLDEVSLATVSQVVWWAIPNEVYYPIADYNIYIIHSDYAKGGEKMLEIIRRNAGAGKKYLSEYSLCEDLRIFYARKLNALFYTNERNTIIFADKLNFRQFHVLQMMIPKYLPLLFKDNPLTESETALLKSLDNKSAVEYELLIEQFAVEFDIRSEIIRIKLAGFETIYERMRIDEISNEIASFEKEYERLLTNMRNLTVSIQDKKYTLAGLNCTINQHSEDSEIMEYFLCNKNLLLIRVLGSVIEFVVHGYADIYDSAAFDKYVQNHNGYFYSNINPAISKPQMEKLYKAIFGENRYKLRLCAAYTADMRTGLKAIQYYSFPIESNKYFPNTHIQNYGCIGTYAARFNEYMKKRDYVGAIDQAVVSARNLNFYDSTVISAFAKELSYSAIKCVENSDGKLMTPIEAIKELEVNPPCQDP